MNKNHQLNGIGRLLLIPAIAFCFTSCLKQQTPGIFPANTLATEAANADVQILSACTSGCWIGTVNQAANSKKIELYSYYAENWNLASAMTWSWKPSTDLSYTSTEVGKWGNPNDFKIREVVAWGGNFIAAIGNGGLITIATYPDGVKRWTATAGGSQVDNIHAVELLPNGNVAVAASTGDYVRVYGASTGATTYGAYTLEDAHAVLWDPAYNTLWAFGTNKLVALKVGGTASVPVLTAEATYTLPSGSGGHAIGAKYGNINEMYVASGSAVWIFNKSTGSFAPAPGLINRVGVKAISNQPDGVVVLTRPDGIKTPVPGEPSTINTWTTSYVDYYSATGTYLSSGHKTGASWYKGFVYNTYYHIPGATIANGKYKIESRLNGKAAVVQGASTASSAKIITWTYSETNDNDEWNITRIGTTGYYRITNVNSGMDMNVQGASYANSADIIQYPYTSDTNYNDEWYLVPTGAGYYMVVNRRSDRVLNVEGAVTADGTQVIQYQYSNTPQCQWQLTIVP